MKTVSRMLWLAILMICVGCQNQTESGGPGADMNGNGEAEYAAATFKLTLPDVTVTQGESTDATLSIDPGSEFNQKVTVSLTPPAGVTVTPSELTLSKDESEMKVAVKAEETATPGDQMIEVSGDPETGKKVTGQIKLTVAKKAAEGDNS